MSATPSRTARVVFALLLTAILVAGAWLLPTHDASSGSSAADTSSSEAPMDSREAVAAPTDHRLPGIQAQPPGFVRAERERIRAHLRQVEQELEARDVSHLSAQAQEARQRQLTVLREYRERGLFPRNVDFPGAQVPVFVDDRGVHCAVGYLLHRSGADSIVKRISEARNFARVPELADEPGLSEWLASVGLSVEEAARIQPTYCGGGSFGTGPCPRDEYPFSKYRPTSVVTGVLNWTMAGINLAAAHDDTPTTGRAWLGMASGAAGLGLGAWGVRHGESASNAGWLNVALGAASAISGYVALRNAREAPQEGSPPQDADDGADGPSPVSVSVFPAVAVDPRGGAGFSVRIRW